MEKRKIFVACPIGSDDSPERSRSDQLLKHVIHPVVNELLGQKPEEIVVRADKMGEPGRITMQVLRELSTSDVVIADLTGPNANVMYEVGIRQALMRPYVLMAEVGQVLPFDLSDFRTIFYVLDLDGVERAQVELKTQLEKALSGQVSVVDRSLFAPTNNNEAGQQDAQAGQNLLVVLEACNQILRETQDVRGLIVQVGGIALDLRDAHQAQQVAQQQAQQQEFGKWMLTQLMEHPESAEKLVPMLQTFAMIGNAQQQPQAEVTPPPNRATRRRQEKNNKKS